jgi:MraZ protein
MDSKGRIAIPAKFRECLTEFCGGRLTMTPHLNDRCIVIYPEPEYELVKKSIEMLPSINPHAMRAQRVVIGNASEVAIDGNGRVLVSQPLRNFAKLDKNLLLMGLGKKMELWDEEAWMKNVVEADLSSTPIPPEMLTLVL